ncbi:hypothetical protein LCGC14_2509850 [marine sediment metagenome]|uniref:Uncharacterized protein n=1 Tax=marine sediment metagenome TaxID=412755 RepID=A0A0F9AZF3_9ZZZZ
MRELKQSPDVGTFLHDIINRIDWSAVTEARVTEDPYRIVIDIKSTPSGLLRSPVVDEEEVR